MEELKQNKKKLKYFVFSLLVIILLFSIISLISYFKDVNIKQENKLEEVKKQIETQTNQSVVIKNVKIPDPNIKNPLTTINPRSSFQNSSGHEIFYIAHDGSAGGINNLYFNYTPTSTSYFSFLGDSLTPILKGWFVQLNTTNITSNRWCNSTACFSTEQFTIDTDTDTDTFNNTVQMQTAINNTGFYNITINQSYGLNTTQIGCTGLLCSIKETFLGIWGDTKYLLLGTKLGNTTAEMDAIDDVGQNSTWQGNQTRIENNIITNGTIQYHDQNLNSTNDIKFNQINSTANITMQFGNKQCWANSTHACWGWNMCNATGCYTGVGV